MTKDDGKALAVILMLVVLLMLALAFLPPTENSAVAGSPEPQGSWWTGISAGPGR